VNEFLAPALKRGPASSSPARLAKLRCRRIDACELQFDVYRVHADRLIGEGTSEMQRLIIARQLMQRHSPGPAAIRRGH